MYNDEAIQKAALDEMNRLGYMSNLDGQAFTSGSLGQASQKAPERSLLDKLKQKRDHAQMQTVQAALLNELVTLLEANPDLARILHLLDITGYR